MSKEPMGQNLAQPVFVSQQPHDAESQNKVFYIMIPKRYIKAVYGT